MCPDAFHSVCSGKQSQLIDDPVTSVTSLENESGTFGASIVRRSQTLLFGKTDVIGDIRHILLQSAATSPSNLPASANHTAGISPSTGQGKKIYEI